MKLSTSPLFLIQPTMRVLLLKNFARYYESVFKLYQSLENALMKSPPELSKNSKQIGVVKAFSGVHLYGLFDLGGRV